MDGLSEGDPGGTFYHSLEWKNVIEESFPFSTTYLVVKDGHGRTVGILPTVTWESNNLKILDSLPYSDFGGPVIDRNCVKEASLSLLRFIEQQSYEKGISLAKICFLGDELLRFFRSSRCYMSNNGGVMELDLAAKPPDFIWKKILRNPQRNRINRFERDGFYVREARTKSDLAKFLTLYYSNMKHINARALPLKFFENMWRILYPENFRILLVEKNPAVGGLAFFNYNQSVYLAYLGIDRESLASRYNVAYYLFWNSIKWAERNGFRYVCFGSTPAHPKSVQEMANHFQKRNFGASFLQQEIAFIPFNCLAFASLLFGSKAISAWKAARNFLPAKLQQSMESRLRGIF